MKKIILMIILVIALGSCKKVRMRPCPDCFFLYFENPQPEDDSELDRFPHRFRGTYKDKDSSFLTIDEDRIIVKYFTKSKIHKNELDSMRSEYYIYNNKIIRKDSKKNIYLYPKGDSLELLETYLDTIFRFSYNQKAKRIDGQLILSTRDSIFWDIQFLSLNNNTLKFKDIYLPTDLKKLDSVTAIKAQVVDSMSYLIKPTRREFKRILKVKNFGTDWEYHKLSK
jgi:hypothetical protein